MKEWYNMEAPTGRGEERKAGMVDTVSDETIGARKVAFTFSASDLAVGCVEVLG